jgi:prephenate dehydrogenase
MKITVIGAMGRMGSWFTRYFSSHGYEIYAYDIAITNDSIRDKSIIYHSNNNSNITLVNNSNQLHDAARVSDVVILCVPINSMLDSLKIARHMHHNATLVEIASLKHRIVKRLRNYASRYNIKGLSIHPLFGPGADIHASNRYALIPVLDRDEELRIARELLSNTARIVVVDDEELHDKVMAYILGMVYVMNVTWSMLVDDKTRRLCKELGGTTYRLQSIIAEGILNDDPSLFSSLLLNRYLKGYIKRFIRLNEDILASIDSKDVKGLESMYLNLKDSIKRDNANSDSIEKSYRLMYKVLASISNNNNEGEKDEP